MCEWSVKMHGQNALDAPCLRLGKKPFFPTLKLIFSLNVHFVLVAMIFSFVIRLLLAVVVVSIVRCRLLCPLTNTHTRSCRSATHTCSPNEPKRLLCMPCCALIPEHMKRCGKWIFRIHSYFARNKFIVANSMVEMVVNSGAGRRYRTIWRIKFHFRKRKCIGLTVENFIRFKRWWCSM